MGAEQTFTLSIDGTNRRVPPPTDASPKGTETSKSPPSEPEVFPEIVLCLTTTLLWLWMPPSSPSFAPIGNRQAGDSHGRSRQRSYAVPPACRVPDLGSPERRVMPAAHLDVYHTLDGRGEDDHTPARFRIGSRYRHSQAALTRDLIVLCEGVHHAVPLNQERA